MRIPKHLSSAKKFQAGGVAREVRWAKSGRADCEKGCHANYGREREERLRVTVAAWHLAPCKRDFNRGTARPAVAGARERGSLGSAHR